MAKIVIVEDDEVLAGTVKSFLEIDNHLVNLFYDGIEGQDFILANDADLIILDWDLPGMSGIEILRNYRTFGGKCPVLILTGHQSIEQKEEGFDTGADDYLTKPFNTRELSARVKVLLRRSQPDITSNVVTVADMVVDFDTNKALKGGQPVKLLPKEFQLLSYLVANRNEEHTRDELLARVWSGDDAVAPEAFNFVLSRLAQKLDPDGEILRIAAIINTDEFKSMCRTVKMPGAANSASVSAEVAHPIAEVADASDSLLGTNLGDRYEMLSVIARGGMGVVYRARHILLDKIVAIKLLNDTYLHDPGAFARFQHEAKVACQLSHPNIVGVHDFGITEDKMLYLVMDYIEGPTLAEILDDKASLPVERVIEIGRQLCDGLEHAHDKDLIHRDLKPSNLIIVQTRDGHDLVKILDFGLAKFTVEGKQQALSQTGYVLGTGFYMSPEQCRGKPADVRSEIYAVGCVLYEAITGLPPFVGDNLLETCQKHIEETAVPMCEVRSDLEIPEAVEVVVRRALEKDPQGRFQSAFELKNALAGLKETPAALAPADAAEPKVVPALANAELSNMSAPSPVVTPASSVFSTAEKVDRLEDGAPGSSAASKVVPNAGKKANARFSTDPILVSVLALSVIAGGAAYYFASSHKTESASTPVKDAADSAVVGIAVEAPDLQFTKRYQDAVSAFEKEQYAQAEKLLQRAVLDARHAGSKSELLIALRKLEDVLYVQKKFQDADLLDQEIRRLAAAAPATAPEPPVSAASFKLVPVKSKSGSANSTAANSSSTTAVKSNDAGSDLSTAVASSKESQDDRIAHLALACHKNGQCDTAVSLLQHSIEVSKRVYGPRSLKTAERLTELATLYMALDQPNEAQPLMNEVMEINASHEDSSEEKK